MKRKKLGLLLLLLLSIIITSSMVKASGTRKANVISVMEYDIETGIARSIEIIDNSETPLLSTEPFINNRNDEDDYGLVRLQN